MAMFIIKHQNPSHKFYYPLIQTQMETSFFSFSLVFLMLNSLTLTSCTTIINSTTDQDALLAFKNGVVSDPYGVLSDWSTNTSICSWTGVSCSLKHHRVTAVNLSNSELGGILAPHLGNLTFLQSLDISSNYFTGYIPSELSNLRRLKAINAEANNLTGEIPSWFGFLPQLQRIILKDNTFSANIPSVIFTNMSSLIEIDVRSNKLSGQLPNDMCRDTPELRRICLTGNQLSGQIPASIYNCGKLEDLFLGNNQFTGSIPSEIGNLTMLRRLLMFSNDLEGEIPSSIFNISSLEYLSLVDNRLSGNIPAFSNLPKIEKLYLYQNNLTGHIPKQLGNLTSLGVLDLSLNKLAGELPEELGNLVYLEEFAASFNDFLSGPIPSSIFNISTLKALSLQQNQFSGTLPSKMGLSLPNLEQLYLYFNRLSGEIPTSITNASKLTMLELNRNSFIGSIPDFGNLRLLQTLRLWENNLTGAESPDQELRFLSSLTNCRDLKNLEISDNPLMNGILPPSIGNLSTSLVAFAASNCSIRGIIPSEIGKLTSLQKLDLSKNQLSGIIPTTMGDWKQLGLLYLYDNQLHGSIPRDICHMNNLVNLDLSGNTLTGSIPECFGELTSLQEVSFELNKLNSTLPSNFFNLKDLITLDLSSNFLSGHLSDQIGRLKAVSWLSLSSNKFSGDIPTSIDGCISLEFLYLSNNMFNGSIPQTLGEVRGLRALDLSNNNLSGFIPTSLEKLDLKHLNASFNKLEGEIPDEGCFARLDALSFLNNSALCGTTRFRVPPCPQTHGRSSANRVAALMKYVVPAFIAVMVMVVCIIFFMRRRKPKDLLPKTDYSTVGVGWKIISERELKQGSNSFSETNLLGRGGIGSVFKATLSDGTDVAVKVFDLQLEGATKSFETESHILSTIRHRNLVKIIGCCSNSEFKALILAYMPNGSLEKWLHSDKYFLDLVQRVKIALDVALALEYLHHGHTFTIVHCDIKPNNVLLDADMTAHVGDFGVSKLFDNGEAAVHTRNMATIGYAAPEFGSEGKISISGDVYSFGILLLEMFTSKKPTDEMFDGEMSIKEWVEKAIRKNAISKIVASGLLAREDPNFSRNLECVTSIFDLAMKCLAFSLEERKNMMQVVAALQKIKAKVPVEEAKK